MVDARNRRRGISVVRIAFAILCGGADAAAAVDVATQEHNRLVRFETDEITAANIDVSPDGSTIAFDLLGDIYLVSVDGGAALNLIRGPAWEQSPRFSPDGKRLGFVSDRGGTFNLWSVDVRGTDFKQHSFKNEEPAARPSWITNQELKTSQESANEWGAQLAKWGDLVAFAVPRGNQTGKLSIRNAATGAIRAYDVSLQQENGEWPQLSFTPDGTALILAASGARIVKVSVLTGGVREIPIRALVEQLVAVPTPVRGSVTVDSDVRAKIIRWPSLSTDGKRVSFAAFDKIYKTELETGLVQRVTTGTDAEYCCAVSPDGKWVAYSTWSDIQLGAVSIIPFGGGTPIQLTTKPGKYANPVWSPDSTKVAFIAESAVTIDGYFNNRNDILWDLQWAAINNPVPETVAQLLPLFQAARYFPPLTFDSTGGRIVFTTARKLGIPSETVIRSVDLGGENIKTHARIVSSVDEIAVSPDGRNIAVSWRGRFAVIKLPSALNDRSEPEKIDEDDLREAIIGVPVGGYFSWQNPSCVVWALANQIRRYEIDCGTGAILLDAKVEMPRPRPVGKLAIINARLLTMRGDEIIERGTMLVESERITAVGKTIPIPADATVFDALGATVIPGLIDVHDHINPRIEREIFPQQRWEYLASLAYGVTTSFDPAAESYDAMCLADQRNAGLFKGPRLFSSGITVYGDSVSYPQFREIASIADARAVVECLAPFRPIMIKEYGLKHREQRRWLLRAAREAGLPVTAEGRGRVRLLTNVIDGYNSVEHDRGVPFANDVLQFMAKSGIHYTPTLMTSARLETYYGASEDLALETRLQRFTPAWALAKFDRFRTKSEDASRERPVAAARGVVRMAAAGVKISTGAHGQLKGLGTHWEMWAFVLGGMSNYDALRASTIVGAQKLGLDSEIGALAPGMLADFLVIDGNPLKDIRDSKKIRFTSVGGFVFDAESMAQVWPTDRPGPRFLGKRI